MKKFLRTYGINLIGLFLFTSILWGFDLFPADLHAACTVMGAIMISVQE